MLTRLPFLALLIGVSNIAVAASNTAVIAAGDYVPQYANNAATVHVDSYALDVYPVSNAEYLRFVQRQPKWQKSQVAALFADEAYLAHWSEDFQPGPLAPQAAPVSNVSWFAAQAYCADQGKRLPSLDEWEYAALADETSAMPTDRGAFNKKILEWYARPSRLPLPDRGHSFRNVWGVWDMHGMVWEWVADFNALISTGESRQDAAGVDRQLFCAAGTLGSSDPADYAAFMRFAMRGSVKARYAIQNMGFRCANDLPSGKEPTS